MSKYIEDLARELATTSLSKAEQEQIIAEVADLLASGVPESDLGSPQDFADAVSPETTQQWTSFNHGHESDRERAYDLQSSLFIPRVFGMGADLNIGALAVKLGLLRPDDIDDDVIAAIPSRSQHLARAVPTTLGVVAINLALSAYRRGLRIPSSTSLTGNVRRFAGLRTGTGLVAGASLAAIVWANQPATGLDGVARPSLASFLTTLLAGSAASAHLVRGNKIPAVASFGPILAGLGLQIGTFVAQIKHGLANVTAR